MRDYFGYEVIFVQNVTDVDDKVRGPILSALAAMFTSIWRLDYQEGEGKALHCQVQEGPSNHRCSGHRRY
jgi:hypothetical protein